MQKSMACRVCTDLFAIYLMKYTPAQCHTQRHIHKTPHTNAHLLGYPRRLQVEAQDAHPLLLLLRQELLQVVRLQPVNPVQRRAVDAIARRVGGGTNKMDARD